MSSENFSPQELKKLMGDATVLCINMHCKKRVKYVDAYYGQNMTIDTYCSQECKNEDEKRERLGLNTDENWKKPTPP